MKLIIDLILTKHNMPKDLYQPKKIMSGLKINSEKIMIVKKLHVVEHKDDTECQHYNSSRYVKVINEDGASVTIKMVVK
jgi:hypothetical protein